MITWFDVPKEGMSPGSKAIIPTGNIELTENGEGINVSTYATATVNVSGGGGGGDFSTAEITLIKPEDYGGCDLYGAFVNPSGYEGLDDPTNFTGGTAVSTSGGGTKKFNLILYKGSALLALSDFESTITTSGAITYLNDWEMYVVTGDGTITIS